MFLNQTRLVLLVCAGLVIKTHTSHITPPTPLWSLSLKTNSWLICLWQWWVWVHNDCKVQQDWGLLHEGMRRRRRNFNLTIINAVLFKFPTFLLNTEYILISLEFKWFSFISARFYSLICCVPITFNRVNPIHLLLSNGFYSEFSSVLSQNQNSYLPRYHSLL